MLALERRNQILEKLQSEKRVVVSELSQFYEVSEETIRRDLDKLEKDGFATKSYGGAVLKEGVSIELPFNVRKNQNVLGKQKMAELAAEMVKDGEHIFLDASTTAIFVAKALKVRKNLTVITNSMEILIELSDISGWNIISTGGTLAEKYLAFLGTRTEKAFRDYYVDKVFFSCKALDFNMGMMESTDSFSSVKKTMMSSGKKNILIAENKKFGQSAFSVVGELGDVDIVITDRRPDPLWMQYFEKLGIACKYPEDNGQADE